nr:lyase family protein [Paraburkholderia hospita]
MPENESDSSIMPGKVDPTHAEALAMVTALVFGDDVSICIGGASGYLKMNFYKPLISSDITHSITIMTDSCRNFRKFLIEGTKPKPEEDQEGCRQFADARDGAFAGCRLRRSSKIAHYAYDNELTLKEAALEIGFVDEAEFHKIVDPKKMVTPYVAHE